MAMLVAAHGMKVQRNSSVSVNITRVGTDAIDAALGTTSSLGDPALFLPGTRVKNAIATIKPKTVTMMKMWPIRGEA